MNSTAALVSKLLADVETTEAYVGGVNVAGCTYISGVAGRALRGSRALSLTYWLRHMRETILFHDVLRTIDEAFAEDAGVVGMCPGLVIRTTLTRGWKSYSGLRRRRAV